MKLYYILLCNYLKVYIIVYNNVIILCGNTYHNMTIILILYDYIISICYIILYTIYFII